VTYSTTYGAERVTVSWQSVTIAEMIEDGKLVRERKERKYARTLPLPVGTSVSRTIDSFYHY
jgi:HSP20 family molecular chaperone IbpA